MKKIVLMLVLMVCLCGCSNSVSNQYMTSGFIENGRTRVAKAEEKSVLDLKNQEIEKGKEIYSTTFKVDGKKITFEDWEDEPLFNSGERNETEGTNVYTAEIVGDVIQLEHKDGIIEVFKKDDGISNRIFETTTGEELKFYSDGTAEFNGKKRPFEIEANRIHIDMGDYDEVFNYYEEDGIVSIEGNNVYFFEKYI